MSNTEIKPLLFKELVLDSVPEAIHIIENVVDEINAELAFKEDVYANVMVALTEAVNNSIVHGNGNDASKKIFIDFIMRNQYRLVVRVRDEGDGFDPSTLPDPTSPENIENIGGRGVFLMRHLADDLKYAEDGKQVEMTFNI